MHLAYATADCPQARKTNLIAIAPAGSNTSFINYQLTDPGILPGALLLAPGSYELVGIHCSLAGTTGYAVPTTAIVNWLAAEPVDAWGILASPREVTLEVEPISEPSLPYCFEVAWLDAELKDAGDSVIEKEESCHSGSWISLEEISMHYDGLPERDDNLTPSDDSS